MKAGRLTVRNLSRHSDAEVERLVRSAVEDLDLRYEGLVVFVENTRKAPGRARPSDWRGTCGITRLHDFPSHIARAIPRETRYVIRARVCPAEVFPETTHERWQEALVAVVAFLGASIQGLHDEIPADRARCDAARLRAVARFLEHERATARTQTAAYTARRARPSPLASGTVL